MTPYQRYRFVRSLIREDRALGLTDAIPLLTVVADRLATLFALGAGYVEEV